MEAERIQILPIDVPEFAEQVRKTFDEETILLLAQSMNEVGQQQPIRVYKDGDRILVLDGERRVRAARKASWKTIAAIFEQKELCPAEIIQRQLISNIQHESLNNFDKATSIQELMDRSEWNATQASKKIGMSNATVSKLLAILKLPSGIQQQIAKGIIPGSAGHLLTQVDDSRRQTELATALAEGRLTRDALSGVVKAAKRKPAANSRANLSRATAVLSDNRSVTIVGAQLGWETLIGWLEELLAKLRKGRTQGVALPTFLRMLKEQSQLQPTA